MGKARSRPTTTTTTTAGGRNLCASVKQLEQAACRVGGQLAPMPDRIEPQLASVAQQPPTGSRWLHEIKFDGYRLLCLKEADRCRLHTRRSNDWTEKFPQLRHELTALPADSCVLDGELVALLPSGASSFELLQQQLGHGATGALVYYVFDLLYLNGYDLRRVPLEQRKQLLAELLAECGPRVRYVEHLAGEGNAFLEACREHKLEGIISKRRDAPYHSGRGASWQKVKCVDCDEFIVAGFTQPQGQRDALGALVLAEPSSDGRLWYCGKVGTGFTDQTLLELRHRLDPLVQPMSPLARRPGEKFGRDVTWVQPELVVQVGYTNRTREGILRHPTYQGIREDLAPETPPASGTALHDHAQETNVRLLHREFTSEEQRQLSALRLSHPEKILFPDHQLTKLDLATYYANVAAWLMPHLIGRPVSLLRCPHGVGSTMFFQRHAAVGTPETLRRIVDPQSSDKKPFLVIDDLAGLMATVQLGALELHVWGCRADRLDRPDRIVFDLDPGTDVAWPNVVTAARVVRAGLLEEGLKSFVKTSGGKGLHVVVPLARRRGWDEVKPFARRCAQTWAAERPDLLTASVRKADREGRVYVDFLRNGRGSTTVAAYSPRAIASAPISTPVHWHELDSLPDAQAIRLDTMVQRLAALRQDPWEEMLAARQTLRRRAP